MELEMYVLYGLGGVVILLLFFCIVLNARLSNLIRRYREFMAGGNGVSLEGTLSTLQVSLREVGEEIAENRRQMAEIRSMMDRAFQAVGVVRFNAFQDTGSDLSFAVAFLDGRGDGVVISSIYGRDESRTYAKPVTAGNSTYLLSSEEKKAIDQAMEKLKVTDERDR